MSILDRVHCDPLLGGGYNAMPILGRSYIAIPILGRTYNVPVLDGCVMRRCIGAEVSRNAYIRSELQCGCSLVLGLTAVSDSVESIAGRPPEREGERRDKKKKLHLPRYC